MENSPERDSCTRSTLTSKSTKLLNLDIIPKKWIPLNEMSLNKACQASELHSHGRDLTQLYLL